MNTEIKNTQEGEKNYNFVQISRGYLKNWRALIRKNSLSAEILMFLIEKMGRTTNAVVCSYKTLSELTGYSRTSIANSLKILRDDNWIETVKIGNATAYCVNERVAWQASRNQRNYAIFSATIVASESEQENDFLKKSKEKLTYIPIIEKNEIVLTGNEELDPPDQLDLNLE
jgi:DNA-binding MarR family transcriptional regulator